MKFRGKRFLITQPIMYSFCGSTVVVIELAEYLRRQEAEVTIYTCVNSEEVANLCKRSGIRIVSAARSAAEDRSESVLNVNLRLADYDYVWVQSEVIPEEMIQELQRINQEQELPYFIFVHLSPHDFVPDEFAWNYQFEEKLADKILFVSEETEESQKELSSLGISKSLFRNPAPLEYRKDPQEKCSLKKVLIVSNHAPKEVEEAAKFLMERNIEVDHLGEHGNKRGMIRPEMIREYDAVVTIGKTVQYCILMNIPVYIYDSFGGPGYLMADNFERAKYHNFSGRGFDKKTGEEIAREVVENFPKKCDYAEIEACDLDDFQIDRAVERIFGDLKKREKENFDEAQVLALCHAQRAAQYRFVEQRDIAYLSAKVEELKRRLTEEKQARKVVSQKLETVTSARSYKMLVKVFGPLNRLREKFGKAD